MTYLDKETEVQVVNPVFRSTVVENGLEILPGLLQQEGLGENRVFVVTDTNVERLYGEKVMSALGEAGVNASIMSMEPGEEHKTVTEWHNFILELSRQKANRNDTIIAMGGGVIGDLVGYVAASYNRKVPLVHVPTTLLAMVDSSIGGKTGIDLGGKNKTGAFYQPELVVADPSVLRTLDQRVFTEGFGEIVKYAMLDAAFYPILAEAAGDIREFSQEKIDLLGKIIARCVQQKCDVIEKDPFEKEPDGRILLNLGHTLAHGLEAAGGYTELLHGEAVAIGMDYVAQLAVTLGFAQPAVVEQQRVLLDAFGLPIRYEGAARIEDIVDHVAADKKNTDGATTRFVLPVEPGVMRVEHVNNAVTRATIEEFLAA